MFWSSCWHYISKMVTEMLLYRIIIFTLSSYWLAPSWSQYGIYTTWIFVVTLSDYMFRYQTYHPIGRHHHGRNMAYTRHGSSSWIIELHVPFRFIVLLAGTIMVAIWYIHDMDFRRDSIELDVQISNLPSNWPAPSWSQYGIYTTRIFIVAPSNYMIRNHTYCPIGWHHHGCNMTYTWHGFSSWLLPNHGFRNHCHPIGRHRHGRNGIESLVWHIPDMDFRCGFCQNIVFC